ncbi:LacI family transcriptional regulator [Falsihalocynthiibacter sp. SS001]|uniref:LacI family transcriptional regulator n=1 Tax=Falsihalocynthiibacter sp. SS001 TaxID=3349698 RepID=UPI0036D20C19
MAKKPGAGRPTQRTIAARAGISVGAVSRALNNDPRIALQTRRSVHKIAAEIGYAPDRAAQRLRTGRTQVINLVLPPHDEILGFGTSVVRGISRALAGSSYHLVVMPDFGIEGQKNTIERVVRHQLADGFIFSRTQPDDERVRYLLEADFPFVTHGRTELATPHPYVDFDNFDFARRAAEQLIAKGAGRLAILLPPEKLTFRQHLLHGFMTSVREAGVAFEIIEGATLDSPPETVKRALEQRFAQPDPPDGLICPGEVSGLAALAAIQDVGLVVGQDVNLIVKQTTGLFGLVRPQVQSLYEDLTMAGFTMAQLLLRRIEGESPLDLQHIQPVSETPVDPITSE